MRVFISWSGPRSKAVAAALRDWLPDVLQMLQPWMSDEDLDKGTRWTSEIAAQLRDTKAGIICVTPQNMNSQWLNFEAGALAKTIENTFVCPYLLGLTPTQLTGPLTQFQVTVADKDDTRKLVGTLNTAIGGQRTPEQLNRAFDRYWPDLEAKLRAVPPSKDSKPTKRPTEEMIEEILTLTRGIRDTVSHHPRHQSGALYSVRGVKFLEDLDQLLERAVIDSSVATKLQDLYKKNPKLGRAALRDIQMASGLLGPDAQITVDPTLTPPPAPT